MRRKSIELIDHFDYKTT